MSLVPLDHGFVGKFAFDELASVVNEDLFDRKGPALAHGAPKGRGACGAFVRMDFEVDPAGGPVDGCEQVLAPAIPGHFWELLHVDVYEVPARRF